MSKIICEICGTIYPDTEPRCPICGWTQDGIDFGDELAAIDEQMIQEEKREALIGSLAQDPRPAYQEDPDTPYGFEFAGFDVRFRVREGVLSVFEIVKL